MLSLNMDITLYSIGDNTVDGVPSQVLLDLVLRREVKKTITLMAFIHSRVTETFNDSWCFKPQEKISALNNQCFFLRIEYTFFFLITLEELRKF